MRRALSFLVIPAIAIVALLAASSAEAGGKRQHGDASGYGYAVSISPGHFHVGYAQQPRHFHGKGWHGHGRHHHKAHRHYGGHRHLGHHRGHRRHGHDAWRRHRGHFGHWGHDHHRFDHRRERQYGDSGRRH